jgi:hypothetical protein
VRKAAGIIQPEPGVLPGMEAADTEADGDAETGVVDGSAIGVYGHAVQPLGVGPGQRDKRPEIDLGSVHDGRRLTTSQDCGPSVLRE